MEGERERLPSLKAHPLRDFGLRHCHVYLLAFLGKMYVKQTFLVFLCFPVFFEHSDVGADSIE